MKDSHMLFVLLAILITPFLPVLLKGKCPSCGKRKLESLDHNDGGISGGDTNPYLAYFHCKACQTRFVREKSGPMQAIIDDKTVDVGSNSVV